MDADKMKFMNELKTDREHFVTNLEKYQEEAEAFSKYADLEAAEDYKEKVLQLQATIDESHKKRELYNTREQLFGWNISEYPLLRELTKTIEPYTQLWTVAADLLRQYPMWLDGAFIELDPDKMQADVDAWYRTLYKLQKTFREEPAPLSVVSELRVKLDEFKLNLPLVRALRNPGLRDRHWKKISEMSGVQIDGNAVSITLNSLLAQNFMAKMDEMQEISV
jgi:dynein heavy chain